MRILYHITLSPPRIPGTDAVFQEIESLNRAFGKKIIRWYPFTRYFPFLPPFVFGIQNLVEIWKEEQNCDIHHIFHSIWYPFPLLYLLRKPVVFTVSGGLAHSLQYRPMNKVHLVLASDQEQHAAEERGWKNTSVVYPGIHTTALCSISAPPKDREFVLLAGSAPWERSKFIQKGFHLMLELVKKNPNIRLITLWRGVLYDEWREMIEESGVTDRVEVINGWADISTILPRVHAAIVLADRGGIVKAWPHSLLEALTAGRPVILSKTIPMSSYVEEKSNGLVMNTMEYEEFEGKVMDLITHYSHYQDNAAKTGQYFSDTRNADAYAKIYTTVLNHQRN